MAAEGPWPDPARVLLVVFAIAVVGSLLFAASTSTAAFGSYNPNWEGTSDLREMSGDRGESPVVLETTAYGDVDPNETVAFVLSPSEPYTGQDVARLREFVTAGGTLVVASDFGSAGNELLADIGATARFDGDVLRDERHYATNPRFPEATNVSAHPYTMGVEQLTLNHGTAVEPGAADVLVRTSEFAYLDRNGNDELDDDEELAAYPVVTVESVGDGTVVAIGDPSLFINSMLEAQDNEAFTRSILTNHEQVLLDYSHAGSQPPLAVALVVLRETPILQALLGGVGLAAVGLGVHWRRWVVARLTAVIARSSRVASYFGLVDREEPEHSAEPAALARYLQEQHPDWDEDRVNRIIAGTLRESESGHDNE